ncbi:hypothetical protein [Geodermatophilus sp. DSM 45219]|uniref:hypothetical protein n=1 Tax=Geodermatophilus sp. DSM 45219 TaxID=1881103 RepID=UPI00088397D9|nr:hypothetical protein [Geodermatophilus sp. DSM 45219]SDO33596.1 LGFP repeat-containing protein [Geodermatophilus sp. DSM 45219]
MSRPSRPSLLRSSVLGLAAAVVVPVLVVAPAARAEEPPVAEETLVGELVQGYADPAPQEHLEDGHADGTLLSWVQTAPGEAVRVPTEDVADVEVGATVEVTLGDAVVDEAAQEGLEPAQEVLAAEVLAAPEEPAVAPATTPVNHPVTVVMLQPAGVARDGTTLQQVVDAVNGPVADFWEQQTRGAVRFGATAGVDWGEPATVGCDEPFQLWQQAAKRAGWTWLDNAHLLVYVPAGAPGCAYGLGTIGGSIDDGGLAYVRAPETNVIAHEFGHNLSLGHSSARQCDGTVDVRPCQVAPYEDFHDVMGYSWGPLGSLNAVHGNQLGVLPAHPVYWYAGARTVFDLAAVSGTSGWQAIELVSEDGTRHFVEYRPASGQDAWLATTENRPGVDAGVQVRAAAAGGDASLLLDATPSPQSRWGSDLQHSLAVGETVSLRDGEFALTLESVSPDVARVLVTTRAATAATEITRFYQAGGGAAGVLGRPVSAEVCGLRDGGCFRHFQDGSIYASPRTGVHRLSTAPRARWAELGWENGRLGYPVTDEVCGLPGGGCFVHFQGGSVYRSASTPAREVTGAVRDRWAATGWERGPLGYPVTSPACGLRDGGCFQHFQGGSVYSTPGTGTRWLSSALRARWSALGWENGRLGYPVTDEVCGLPGGGCFAHFQGGSVYRSPTTGVHDVSGAIRDRWAAAGWERGALGYPVGDPTCGLRAGGCFQQFQRGSTYWTPATGARWMDGPIRDAWGAQGWENGPLGYPVTDLTCGLPRSGCYVHFQGGSVYVSADSAAHAVSGRIRDAWAALGWERGLGYPVEGSRAVPYGETQRFQNGTLALDHRTGQVRRI